MSVIRLSSKPLSIAVFFILGLFLISGCAATVDLAKPELDQAAKEFVPPADQASIYITRKDQFTGGAVLFQVVVDSEMQGAIAPGTYHWISVKPGPHVVTATSMENQASLKVDAVAGQSYFFEVKPKVGWMAARVDIIQMPDPDGRAAVAENELAQGFDIE